MTVDADRAAGRPSAFFLEHTARLEATRAIGPSLDLACGRGRHSLAAAALGLRVVAVDRNAAALDDLTSTAGTLSISTLVADLESPPLPALDTKAFGAVLVFRYLHRALFPWIESRIAPGGILLYETFTIGQRELGWGPRRDDFLLGPGELPTLLRELTIEIYEEGPSRDEPSARTARLLASRPA